MPYGRIKYSKGPLTGKLPYAVDDLLGYKIRQQFRSIGGTSRLVLRDRRVA
jgi:hypothetical protein